LTQAPLLGPPCLNPEKGTLAPTLSRCGGPIAGQI
jgi:hypothetical protein